MANDDEGWTSNFYHSTHPGHALEYTVNQRAGEHYETRQPCTLVSATVDEQLVFNIPCFFCYRLYKDSNNINIDTYLSDHEQKFAATISSHLDHIPRCCANVIASTFKSILDSVLRRCLDVGQACPATFHLVEIYIEENEVEESEVVEESFDLEAAGPKMKPASVAVVRGLRRLKYIHEDEEGDRYENGWSASDHQCTICFDEIPTRSSSFSMGCSHFFHENCLLEWLDTSHVCPLCRYQLPTDN